MKRFLLCFALFCSLSFVAHADEALREAQTRLKEDGFFFGEPNGEAGSETGAAISRYQIRHGLQITGQLDAPTAKALGVTAVAARATPAPVGSEAWRRLRKMDERFLKRLNDGEIRPPAPAPGVPAGGRERSCRLAAIR